MNSFRVTVKDGCLEIRQVNRYGLASPRTWQCGKTSVTQGSLQQVLNYAQDYAIARAKHDKEPMCLALMVIGNDHHTIKVYSEGERKAQTEMSYSKKPPDTILEIVT